MALIVVTPATTSGTSTTWTSAARTAASRWTTTISLGPRFIDIQSAPTQFLTIKCSNSLLGFGGIPHFDECKTTRTAGITISYDSDLLDGPVGFKQRPQLCFGSAVGDVPDEQLLHNGSSCCKLKCNSNSGCRLFGKPEPFFSGARSSRVAHTRSLALLETSFDFLLPSTVFRSSPIGCSSSRVRFRR